VSGTQSVVGHWLGVVDVPAGAAGEVELPVPASVVREPPP